MSSFFPHRSLLSVLVLQEPRSSPPAQGCLQGVQVPRCAQQVATARSPADGRAHLSLPPARCARHVWYKGCAEWQPMSTRPKQQLSLDAQLLRTRAKTAAPSLSPNFVVRWTYSQSKVLRTSKNKRHDSSDCAFRCPHTACTGQQRTQGGWRAHERGGRSLHAPACSVTALREG